MLTPRQNHLRAGNHRGEEMRGNGVRWGRLLTGLVVVGLGVMAWRTLAPDLRRYMKIRNM